MEVQVHHARQGCCEPDAWTNENTVKLILANRNARRRIEVVQVHHARQGCREPHAWTNENTVKLVLTNRNMESQTSGSAEH